MPTSDILFHHQQYGREDVVLASPVNVCVAVGVYPIPPPAVCELEGVFISTVNSVDMRVYRMCGRKGVSLSLVNIQQCKLEGVSLSTTSSVWTYECIHFHSQQCGRECVSIYTAKSVVVSVFSQGFLSKSLILPEG